MPDIFVSPPAASTPLPDKPRTPSLLESAFSSYLLMPKGIRFETQQAGETIILLLRKHMVTNIPWILLSIILLLTPVIVFPVLLSTGNIPSYVPASFISVIIIIWYLFTASYIFVQFLLWYFTVSIVTQERIIDIDFDTILTKKFAATRISKIEDVTQRTGGFIRAIFNYGDVFVQTAATAEQFQFYAVPHPVAVVRIINNLMEKQEEGNE